MPYPQGRKRSCLRPCFALICHLSHSIPHSSFLIPHSSLLIPHSSFLTPHSHSSFGIIVNTKHFHPILLHITHGAPLGLALNLSCGSPFARPQLSRCLTHTGVGVSPIQVSVSHPYTQRGLTHRTFIFSFFHFSEALPFFHFSEAHFPPIRRARRSFCVFCAFCVNYSEPPRLYKRTCHTENRRNIFPNTD